MIGIRIESRPDSWFFVACTLAATALCVGMSVVQSDVGWLVAAIMPGLLAVVLWIARRRRFGVTVLDDGLQLDVTNEMVRFDQIDSLIARTYGRHSFPMTLVVGGRKFEIPARLNLPSSDVRELLLKAIPRREQVPLDPQLAEFYAAQRERFGPDRVWHAAGHTRLHKPPNSVTVKWLLASLFVASLVYVGYGGAAQRDALGVIGGVGLAVSGIGAFIVFIQASSRKSLRSKQSFGLIICPVGLAMLQAELKGELRWEEIRAVRFRQRPAHLSVGREGVGAGIDLEVAGAVIKILDVYDQPLDVIHQRIASNWQKPD